MSTVQSQTQSLPTGTWQLDPVHSQVGFAVKYMVGTFRGSFSPVAATLEVGADGTASLAGSAKAESVKVQEPNLVAHLRFRSGILPSLALADTHPSQQ